MASLVKRLEKLIDNKIVSEAKEAVYFTDEPKFPQFFCEPLGAISEEQYGSSLDLNKETAKIKAIGEAVERYCSEKIDETRLLISSYEEIKESALDPTEFINFSNNFLNKKKENYRKKIKESELSWIEGYHLNSKENILIPAQLVYSDFDISKEPIIRLPISTGAAFGLDKNSTIDRGIHEIIERDNFMISWLSKRKCPLINLEKNNLYDLKEYFERYRLEPYVFDIRIDNNVPSMLGILIDRTGIGPAVSTGLSSDLNAKKATINSLLEAQHVRGWVRFSHIKDGHPKINNPKQILNMKSRGYYWYPTKRIKDLEFLLNSSEVKDISTENSSIERESLSKYLMSNNFDIFTVDISIPNIKTEGFRVIKTIIPQFHPLYLGEDIPYHYSSRLLETFKGGEINKVPHPFL